MNEGIVLELTSISLNFDDLIYSYFEIGLFPINSFLINIENQMVEIKLFYSI
jgi:hypothetical protein